MTNQILWLDISSVSHTEQKILLGSVQRLELIELLERHVGAERRLEVVAQRQTEMRYCMLYFTNSFSSKLSSLLTKLTRAQFLA